MGCQSMWSSGLPDPWITRRACLYQLHREQEALSANETRREIPMGEEGAEGSLVVGGSNVRSYHAHEKMQLHYERAKLLLRSFKNDYWYWESLELLRKYLLTSLVLVVAHNTLLQVSPSAPTRGIVPRPPP